MAPRELWTAQTAAAAIGVQVATLQKWRNTGQYDLPYIKSGRLIRYDPTDVSAFIERRKRTHTSAA